MQGYTPTIWFPIGGDVTLSDFYSEDFCSSVCAVSVWKLIPLPLRISPLFGSRHGLASHCLFETLVIVAYVMSCCISYVMDNLNLCLSLRGQSGYLCFTIASLGWTWEYFILISKLVCGNSDVSTRTCDSVCRGLRVYRRPTWIQAVRFAHRRGTMEALGGWFGWEPPRLR